MTQHEKNLLGTGLALGLTIALVIGLVFEFERVAWFAWLMSIFAFGYLCGTPAYDDLRKDLDAKSQRLAAWEKWHAENFPKQIEGEVKA